MVNLPPAKPNSSDKCRFIRPNYDHIHGICLIIEKHRKTEQFRQMPIHTNNIHGMLNHRKTSQNRTLPTNADSYEQYTWNMLNHRRNLAKPNSSDKCRFIRRKWKHVQHNFINDLTCTCAYCLQVQIILSS